MKTNRTTKTSGTILYIIEMFDIANPNKVRLVSQKETTDIERAKRIIKSFFHSKKMAEKHLVIANSFIKEIPSEILYYDIFPDLEDIDFGVNSAMEHFRDLIDYYYDLPM